MHAKQFTDSENALYFELRKITEIQPFSVLAYTNCDMDLV